MKESVAAERAHCQRHQEGEQELEAGLLEDGYEDHAQQRQQADDGDGHKTPQPHQRWRKRQTDGQNYYLHFTIQWGSGVLVSHMQRVWSCSMTHKLWRCIRKKGGPVGLIEKLSWFCQRKDQTNSYSFAIIRLLAGGIFPPCSHVKESILHRFSIHVSLWWHTTPEARNAKWHFSRILLASFFIQGHRHDTWSRTGKRQKGTLSFKLPVHLSARDAFQNSRKDWVRKTLRFVHHRGQSL